jgi:hypothetical protein
MAESYNVTLPAGADRVAQLELSLAGGLHALPQQRVRPGLGFRTHSLNKTFHYAATGRMPTSS